MPVPNQGGRFAKVNQCGLQWNFDRGRSIPLSGVDSMVEAAVHLIADPGEAVIERDTEDWQVGIPSSYGSRRGRAQDTPRSI